MAETAVACRIDIEVPRREFTVRFRRDLVAGEVHALMGPNGAGKSTVAETLAGLLRPTRGTVRLGTHLVTRITPGAGRGNVLVPPAARAVGYLDQHPRLFPHLSAADNVAFGLRVRGRSRAAARAIAHGWLERVGSGELAHAHPADLSGGQQQRVAIARTLATEPALLVLDEPFAALSTDVLPAIRERVRAFLAELSITTLLITHDAVDAWALADHLSVMERGRVVETGRASELLSHPRSPLTARLLGVNRLGVGTGPDARLVVFSPGAVVVTDAHPAECAIAHSAAAGLWVHGTISAIEAVPAGVGVRVRVEGGALIRAGHGYALPVLDAPSFLAEMPPGRRVLPGESVCCRVSPDRLADYPVSSASA